MISVADYDWSSNKYSAWSESRWGGDAIKLRVFLVPGKEKEVRSKGQGTQQRYISERQFFPLVFSTISSLCKKHLHISLSASSCLSSSFISSSSSRYRNEKEVQVSGSIIYVSSYPSTSFSSCYIIFISSSN